MPALTTEPSNPATIGPAAVLLRAIFLACSWTWCIGMFFPVYLIGDFGVWGWVAFAVPNVIGAGAMGWVLRRRGASEALTGRHLTAARWFSIVTVLFHIAFGSWFFEAMLAGAIGQRFIAGTASVALMVVIGCVLASFGSKGWYRLAAVAFAASGVAALAASMTGNTLRWPDAPPRQTLTDLALATPLIITGFALCPYLDLTFHRVRRETPGREGAAAFWVGFIGCFAPMIVLTLFYAGGVLGGAGVSLYIVGHIFVQSTFTVGAHLRELFEVGFLRSKDPYAATTVPNTALQTASLMALGLAASSVVLITYLDPIRENYSFRRLVYELYMSFYGLVFPAYVWIAVIERGLPRPTRLALCAVAVALAAPCLWFGYIQQRYAWLLPGVAIPLVTPYLGRLLAAGSAARS